MAGLVLDPWQRLILEDALGERRDGQWSAFEVAILVARQNGKGGALEARELAGMFLFGEQLILHSAHQFKTAAEAFLRIKALVENTDSLRKRVRKVTTSHGEEGIELLTGQRLRFVARSRTSARGFSGDCVILDEAQELPTSAMGALMPTLSARPNPQVWYAGTVPEPDNDAEHWTRVRDRGRDGQDASLAWLEWSPGEESDDLDDRAAWAAANPALGYRITEETIARERAALGEGEFARERLSVWPAEQVGGVLPLRQWSELVDVTSQAGDQLVLAIDVTPDRESASIGCAARRADGRAHLEVIDSRPGVGWLVPRLVELVARWSPGAVVLDTMSPAVSLVSEAQAARLPLVTTSTADMVAACGALYDAVVDGTLRHLGQPELSAAIAGARKRPLRDSWAFSRRTGADITPLVAVTLALHGLAVNEERFSRRSAYEDDDLIVI
jgi:hypothetical protein